MRAETMPFSLAIIKQQAQGVLPVIPDIKCVSPKDGDLLRGRDPVQVATSLASWGAPVLSVVTESEHFGGSPKLLEAIAAKAGLPVLRKDFIRNKEALHETKHFGASAVLLIAAIVDERTLAALYEHALKMGLEPLVEVCTATEMVFAKTLNPQLLGINNKNILDLERDSGNATRTQHLAEGKPKNALLISESGILSCADAKQAVSAGADAILVGTALWQAADMKLMYQELRKVTRD